MANILRTVFPQIESRFKPRTQGVIQRVNLCRTPPLGTHRYRCDPCGRTLKVYNSCGQRHCPICHGGQRDAWIAINAPRLIPNTAYLQIVFTLPNKFSNLILANRKVLYRLLMQTAWDELKRIMRQLGIEPSAMVVLHTWNQRLEHHVHVHVLIPGGGISLDGTKWISIEDDLQFRAGTNWPLSKRFRKTFCRRLNLLNQRGKLNLPGNLACLRPVHVAQSSSFVGHSSTKTKQPTPMQQWLEPIAPHGFRVFVQPPPQFDVVSENPSKPQRLACPPERLLNYMARYVGGGPIKDSRLRRWENGYVTFLARSRDEEEEYGQLMLFDESDPEPHNSQLHTRHSHPESRFSPLATRHSTGINLPLSITKPKEEVTISEEEFVRRWAMHILPRGFMRVQHYGATSRRRGTEYLARCRKLLGIEEPGATAPVDKKSESTSEDDPFELVNETEPEEKPYEPTWKCTKCGKLMDCLEFQLRPSWRVVFESLDKRASNEIQLQLWTANELHEMRYTATNPVILDSS